MNFNHKPVKPTFNSEEQFELLSAYIDNEVSPDERRQVEYWLDTDANFKRLYQQQLRLQRLLIDLPVPTKSQQLGSSLSTEQFINQVMAKAESRSQRRWVWGGGIAIAAALVATIGSVLTLNSPVGQFNAANNQINQSKPLASEENLILAMEKPIVPLPKSMTDK